MNHFKGVVVLFCLVGAVHFNLGAANYDAGEDTVKVAPADDPVLSDTTKTSTFWDILLKEKGPDELKKELANYGVQKLPAYLQIHYLRMVDLIFRYPVVLLFLLLIIFFIVSNLIVLFILNCSNNYKIHRKRYISVYRNMYEGVVLSYLFGEIDWEKAIIRFRRLKKPLNRRIMVSILFNYQENLRGEMDKQIPEIFVKLGLHKDAMKSVRSPFFHRKVEGIRELTHMVPEKAKEVIKKYINHSNDDVRSEAQTSYILLHPDNPFGFFRILVKPFSRWTQLSVFLLFRHNMPFTISFSSYLRLQHTNVRNFSLRMITFLQQLENEAEILKMLESNIDETRFLGIKAINDLRLKEGKELIKVKYRTETDRNRMEIIKALKNIGDEQDFKFLELIVQFGTVSERIEACRSLYFVSDAGKERLVELNKKMDLELEPYVAHVTDPRN